MYSIYGRPLAVACICGGEESGVTGTVRFYRHSGGTMVVAEVRGLPESDTGFYGFHIHEGGDCRGEGFANSKGHYNPLNTEHPKHAGDLPPLLGCNGSVYLAVLTGRFHVRDIIGRTVVIHGHPDDFHSQPAGDSGKKIACGVIRKV